MKRFLLLIVLAVLVSSGYAQTPQMFNYQAVARDASGVLLAEQSLNVRIGILQDDVLVWQEDHAVQTNKLGLFTLHIGDLDAKGASGTAGSFENIDWANGLYKIQVAIDNGSGFIDLGASELVSVPYALYAENAEGWSVSDGELVSDYPINVLTEDPQVEEPLFQVKNNLGIPVFAVYNDGVVVYVDEERKTKGLKSGFAVGGYNKATKGISQTFMSITPDSTNIYFDNDETKGIKGGFAVGGYNSSKANGPSKQMMSLTAENYLIGQEAGYSITTGLNNSFLGYQTGLHNTTGYDNVFLGKYAGYKNISGSNNLFLGNNAGADNTEGERNVFIGEEAGRSNYMGDMNVMIGYQAGLNSKGEDGHWDNIYNVIIGHQAGYGNIDGGAKVLIGHMAGYTSTSSNYMIAIGNSAGYNATGDDNTFIGGESGWMAGTSNNSTFLGHMTGRGAEGNDNTYIGRGAGYSGNGNQNTALGAGAGWGDGYTTRDHNTLIGYQSGGRVTTGGYNAALGHSTLRLTTTGYNNTVMGYRAGFSLVNGYGNVFIGYKAGEDIDTNNKLYIDNSDDATPLIYGDFENDYVTINGYLSVTDQIMLGGLSIKNMGSSNLGLSGDIVPYGGTGLGYDLGNSVEGESWDQVVAAEFITYSDFRTKKNISDLSYGLSEIMQLRPVQFQYLEKFNPSNKMKYGLIAQEVEEVLPEVVINEDIDVDSETGEVITTENEYKLMNYVELVPVLINAVQEQQKQIEDLKLRIEELENQ